MKHPIKRKALNKPRKGSEYVSGGKLHSVAKRCPDIYEEYGLARPDLDNDGLYLRPPPASPRAWGRSLGDLLQQRQERILELQRKLSTARAALRKISGMVDRSTRIPPIIQKALRITEWIKV